MVVSSAKADKQMIDSHSQQFPPAVYEIGERIVIRRFSSKSWKKARRGPASRKDRIVEGTVIKHSEKSGNYKVHYAIEGKVFEEWVSVADITSVTKEQEKDKHQQRGILHIIVWVLFRLAYM